MELAEILGMRGKQRKGCNGRNGENVPYRLSGKMHAAAPEIVRCVGAAAGFVMRCIYTHGALCFDPLEHQRERQSAGAKHNTRFIDKSRLIAPGRAVPAIAAANDNEFLLNGCAHAKDNRERRWSDAKVFLRALNDDSASHPASKAENHRPMDYTLMRSVLALSNAIAEDGTLTNPAILGALPIMHGVPRERRYRAFLAPRPRFLARRKCGSPTGPLDPQI